jgi:hypothetical protein
VHGESTLGPASDRRNLGKDLETLPEMSTLSQSKVLRLKTPQRLKTHTISSAVLLASDSTLIARRNQSPILTRRGERDPQTNYTSRRAIDGSVRAARIAGAIAAVVEQAISKTTAAINVSGSTGDIP